MNGNKVQKILSLKLRKYLYIISYAGCGAESVAHEIDVICMQHNCVLI